MKASDAKLENKHGKVLKLFGGMITLALFIKPEMMSSLDGSLIVFALVMSASLVTLFAHQQLLPRRAPWEIARRLKDIRPCSSPAKNHALEEELGNDKVLI